MHHCTSDFLFSAVNTRRRLPFVWRDRDAHKCIDLSLFGELARIALSCGLPCVGNDEQATDYGDGAHQQGVVKFSHGCLDSKNGVTELRQGADNLIATYCNLRPESQNIGMCLPCFFTAVSAHLLLLPQPWIAFLPLQGIFLA